MHAEIKRRIERVRRCTALIAADLEFIEGAQDALTMAHAERTGEGKVSYSDDGTRMLKSIGIHERSLVAVPSKSESAGG